MTDPFDNEQLEKLLREEEPYISNDDFSQNVVESLPARRRLTWRVKRRIIKGVSVCAGVGCVLGILLSNGAPNALQDAMANPMIIAVSLVSVVVAIGATCVWVMSDRA